MTSWVRVTVDSAVLVSGSLLIAYGLNPEVAAGVALAAVYIRMGQTAQKTRILPTRVRVRATDECPIEHCPVLEKWEK